MAGPIAKPRPWLIAAWPGMGNVAIIAASHLIEQLKMDEVQRLPPGGHFDVVEIDVKGGLVEPLRLPYGVFFRWNNTGAGRDVVVFVSAAQPLTGSYGYAHSLLDVAARLGVERVVTFASLASGLHPSENPRVSGVATDAATLAELRRAEVEPLADGQIGGLNGLVLGVAAERGMTGMCLLAEIPFFAMRVPNPKAARAALSVFSVLAGIDVSLEQLNRQAAIIDRVLLDAVEKMEREKEREGGRGEQEDRAGQTEEGEEGAEDAHEEVEPRPKGAGGSVLEEADRERIEKLFEETEKDTGQAVKLKSELDRLGVFKEYEGRFLDLFRRAG